MIDTDKIWRISPKGKPKDSFVLFYSTIDAVRTAFQGDVCKLGIWFDAVLEYELYGTKPTFDEAEAQDVPILQAMFEITKSQLEINHQKWLKTCEKNKENADKGKKGDNP